MTVYYGYPADQNARKLLSEKTRELAEHLLAAERAFRDDPYSGIANEQYALYRRHLAILNGMAVRFTRGASTGVPDVTA